MFEKIRKYIVEVRQETAKVIWPTRGELRDSSVIVIVMSLMLAFFIFLVNYALTGILKLIL